MVVWCLDQGQKEIIICSGSVVGKSRTEGAGKARVVGA